MVATSTADGPKPTHPRSERDTNLDLNLLAASIAMVFAVRALTWVIAPVLFAEIYAFSKSIDHPAMCMFMGSGIILISLTVILWPLKRAMKDADLLNREYTFSHQDVGIEDEDEEESNESVPLLIENHRVAEL